MAALLLSVVLSFPFAHLFAKEAQPAQTVAELVRAGERLKREFPRITLPGHAHDLLNDVDREQVMADITAWINARA
jgi:hypothetical protein